eukprot:597957-Pyramimonas_sp.AAC.2
MCIRDSLFCRMLVSEPSRLRLRTQRVLASLFRRPWPMVGAFGLLPGTVIPCSARSLGTATLRSRPSIDSLT